MVFNLKKRTGFIKKRSIIEKIEYLEENLGVIESQRHLDAIEGIGMFYRKRKELSEDQEMYLDILIGNVMKIRGIE